MLERTVAALQGLARGDGERVDLVPALRTDAGQLREVWLSPLEPLTEYTITRSPAAIDMLTER